MPQGDYILALTAGEEDGVANGVQWLLAHRPELIRAGYSINVDGGGPEIRGGKPAQVSVETAEKVYLSYTLTARNPGGHSSLPTPDNAIYRLAHGLVRLSALRVPAAHATRPRVAISRGLAALDTRARWPTTCARWRTIPPDPAALARLAASSTYNNAQLRTTCVPTLLARRPCRECAAADGPGHGQLPDVAGRGCRASVDRRTEAGHGRSRRSSRAASPTPHPSPPTRSTPTLFARIAEAGEALVGPRCRCRPYMSAGATDSVFLRAAGMPSYVFNGIPYDVDDDRSHGQDERIRVDSFDQSLEFTYRLLKTYEERALALIMRAVRSSLLGARERGGRAGGQPGWRRARGPSQWNRT